MCSCWPCWPVWDVVPVMWDPTIPAESASLRGPVGPVMPLRTFPLSDQVGGECMDIHGGWSGADVAGTPTVVAAVDLRAGSTETDFRRNVRTTARHGIAVISAR